MNSPRSIYHERWEIETALDELKTHLRGARIVLRSRTPELVRQEFYGLIMAHFAIRNLMHEAALKADEDPDRLSFLHAVRVIRRKLAAAAAIPPRKREAFHQATLIELLQERLPPRAGQRNPRGVKRKMTGYPIRRRGQPPLPRLDLLNVIQILK